VDITVKRVPGGLVSCYLHDRAFLGLTVSARPPAGRFVLLDPLPRRLLCLAAGSGITPVMSIVRWIDDACLPIEASPFPTHDGYPRSGGGFVGTDLD
jgi:ferredoxin-NADP reductase